MTFHTSPPPRCRRSTNISQKHSQNFIRFRVHAWSMECCKWGDKCLCRSQGQNRLSDSTQTHFPPGAHPTNPSPVSFHLPPSQTAGRFARTCQGAPWSEREVLPPPAPAASSRWRRRDPSAASPDQYISNRVDYKMIN